MEKNASLAFVDIHKLLTIVLNNYQFLSILIMPYFSGMLYDFFQKGMIFSLYGDWVFKEFRKNEEIKKLNATREDKVPEIKPPIWKKPLGECLKCFHIWVCIIFGFLFLPALHLFTIYIFLPGILRIEWQPHWFLNIVKFILAISVSYFILVRKYYR